MTVLRTALALGGLALVAACGNDVEPAAESTPTSTPSASIPATVPLRTPGPAKRPIELDRVIYTEVPGGSVVRARVDGTAQVFEGTVQYELKAADKPATKGFTTASVGAPGRGTISIVLTLDRGTAYTLTAWEDDMATGGRGKVVSAALNPPA
jgi:Immunoglobulin-like domain of bacterial spore germination